MEQSARRVAALRGHVEVGGAWIRDRDGGMVCHGWSAYAEHLYRHGVLVRVEPGRYFVSLAHLTTDESSAAERIYGTAAAVKRGSVFAKAFTSRPVTHGHR